MLSKGHGKALLTEPDHHRRRVLARRAVDHGWSVRALEAEIARDGAAPRIPSRQPADQAAAAARLEDTLTRATGCELRARPYRHGYQIIVDHHAAQRLAELLAAQRTPPESVPRGTGPAVSSPPDQVPATQLIGPPCGARSRTREHLSCGDRPRR